ncbi:MAG: hypothetical protein HW385_1620, partial [candidate division NC10 bacterium]|nr:hypothetical protein [candidate division NC10 bacterium]
MLHFEPVTRPGAPRVESMEALVV